MPEGVSIIHIYIYGCIYNIYIHTEGGTRGNGGAPNYIYTYNTKQETLFFIMRGATLTTAESILRWDCNGSSSGLTSD